MNQTEFAELAGVLKGAQLNYEAGKRAPDSNYMAAVATAGVDVRYVLTGEREFTPPPALTAEEQTMLDYFRDASREVRKAALGALLGAQLASSHVGGSHTSSGANAVHMGHVSGVGMRIGKAKK
nr:helix-turn-helix transcriptional regulator [uncultured Albidiferax sp.]